MMKKEKEEILLEKEAPKYILLQNEYTLSYTDEDCLVNDIAVENKSEGKLTGKELCFEKQKSFYDSFLKRHFKNIVVLSAAGTSLDNGPKGESGKSRLGLWDFCEVEIEAFTGLIEGFKEKSFYKNKDIEGLLSFIILYEKLNGELKTGDDKLKQPLESKIIEACNLKLQPLAPHKDFLNKIIARKPSDPRVQLFTTNYDLLFETAANESGFIVIDGFSFTQPRRFSGRYFDLDIVNREKTRIKQEESFISKVIHLYKLHGSLNWFKDDTDRIIQQDNPTKPLIIYPANEKYESSFEQPYFEMMSRFQQSLRKENTLLIVIGFGFQDKHIQNVIIEAVEQNPSFQLLIVNYGNTGGIDTTYLKSFFVDKVNMQVKRNVSIVFDTFSGFTKNYPSNSTYIEPHKDIADGSL
ncbi:SIR2 family protein [Algoriphagus chordae]|uniref:Replication restart DNA helicase PriA n=1 Tax=Algoriphagus chordae TaxID=237019 RepID=A0A2W7STF7_9BACT|nr:SIR2 family protein [Algoriphagus chordae]PZX53992.1 replication restart DNA helicase PriA [Algoriphagus chordae]